MSSVDVRESTVRRITIAVSSLALFLMLGPCAPERFAPPRADPLAGTPGRPGLAGSNAPGFELSGVALAPAPLASWTSEGLAAPARDFRLPCGCKPARPWEVTPACPHRIRAPGGDPGGEGGAASRVLVQAYGLAVADPEGEGGAGASWALGDGGRSGSGASGGQGGGIRIGGGGGGSGGTGAGEVVDPRVKPGFLGGWRPVAVPAEGFRAAPESLSKGDQRPGSPLR